jgi:hypothetical protein
MPDSLGRILTWSSSSGWTAQKKKKKKKKKQRKNMINVFLCDRARWANAGCRRVLLKQGGTRDGRKERKLYSMEGRAQKGLELSIYL